MTDVYPNAHHVLVGKRGMLFLQNDSNRTLSQITGTYPLHADFMNRWSSLFLSRKQYATERGFRYLFMIAPAKEVVYAGDLPDGVPFTEDRPVRSVERACNASGIECIYPLANLRDRADTVSVYPAGDTHWTFHGAYLAYSALMGRLGLDWLALDRFAIRSKDVAGDLSGKIGRSCTTVVGDLHKTGAHLVFDNSVAGVGGLKIFENASGRGRCVVFRDSFTVSLENMFAESFARCCFVWQPNFDFDIIQAEQPDYVVSVMAERFLVHVPQDQTGCNNQSYAALKQNGSSSRLSRFDT